MSAAQLLIGLNLIFLVPGETGGLETYARQLIPALLAAAPPGMRFTAFINREAAAAGDGPWGDLLPAVTLPVNARSRVQRVLGEQTLLPRLAAREGVDLMHSLANTAPLRGRFRRVVTVHDLIYAHFPEATSRVRDKGVRALLPQAVRRSHRVIAISQSTRRDLIELLKVPPNRVDVVPQGPGTAKRHKPLPEGEVRARFDLGERRVVLSLSAKRPHKNLRRLIGALARIPSERRPLLVLPGYATPHELELRGCAAGAGIAADVRFLGWVSASEIEGLWGAAGAFVFPSLYEGFGLPVLEAMARGVPVACSNVSSLTEVAGESALLFDPLDECAIAQAILAVLENAPLRERLARLGRERAREFTWERTAHLTLACYASALPCAPDPGLRRARA